VRLLVLMMRPRVSMISRLSSRSSSSNSSIMTPRSTPHRLKRARHAAFSANFEPVESGRVANGRAGVLPGPSMASTQEFRKNMKLLVDGTPYVCLEAQFVKPGKGQAFTRCRLKNLVTGNVIERTYKSGESVELADIEQRKMQYIYPEGDAYVFMNQETGDQIHVGAEHVGDEK